ncbi:MAG TPA: hypothetical protein VF403_22600, partial [Kofleriaceae bacterium]
NRFMTKRKNRTLRRTRTVVVYRDKKLGYYSRDRVAGGMSPIYSTEANLVAARLVRAETTPTGTKGRWPAVS